MLGLDTSTPAVVLKFDPNVLHHGGLGVIRSLGRFGVPVYGVHEETLAPAAYSRYLSGRWLWRPGDTCRVLDDLRELARRIGRRAVVLPTDDAGAIFLAEHGETLRESFLFPAPSRHLPRQLAGKHTMYRLCRRLGTPCPESAVVGRWQDAREFADRVGLPLVGKVAAPWLSGKKVRSTTILRTLGEVHELYRACEDSGGLMLQEFLSGGPERDWFFHGYCDANSRCVPAFTGMKERSYPAHAGLTSLGRAVENPELRREATDLLARLRFRGIVDLDFRWDHRDGRYKLLDFNPRLGAQFRLFRDPEGLDVALAAYRDLTGQGIRDNPPLPGRRFVVENYDPISAVGYWQRGELGLRSWVASLRGVDEAAWFARDDVLPFALMCLWMGWRAVRKPLPDTRFHRGPRNRERTP